MLAQGLLLLAEVVVASLAGLGGVAKGGFQVVQVAGFGGSCRVVLFYGMGADPNRNRKNHFQRRRYQHAWGKHRTERYAKRNKQ